VTRLLGIYREPEYSPGRHRSNDAWLLEAVAEALRVEGATVDLAPLDRAAARRDGATLIFSMCQGRAALETLARWARDGAVIVNSPRAARNTHRDRLPALMVEAGVPFPETRLVDTRSPHPDDLEGDEDRRLWLKRGDIHASVASDVQPIDSTGALVRGLADFVARGVDSAALQMHQVGDEIKFYGVADGGFFHWCYQRDAHGYRFDPALLVSIAQRAASAAGVEIFGGDVIVSPAGELTLIDLNDWPSFAPCRDAAAGAIAGYLTRRVHAAWHSGVVSGANESAV
jgi:hypothetical protein